ncbi:AAA family ATPase [Candidatus Poribacteria bacterium]|nr:AAA family ATPase [Candidatus Poribacteria bacterium]
MKTLFVTSTSDYCGKTVVALGLGKKLQSDGFKVGYMKAVGTHPTKDGDRIVDSDALLIHTVLDLEDPIENVSPVVVTQDLIMQAYEGEDLNLGQKIIQAYEEISKDKDIVLISGPGKFSSGTSLGVSARKIINDFNANALIIDKSDEDVSIDEILMIKEILQDKVVGAVLNQVEFPKLDFIERRVKPFLTGKGVDVLGVFLKDPILMSVTIRELADTLGGEIICCEHRADDLVERFSVGAMNVEGALKYFRKVRSKAVITGGDRADIQLAALETDTRCLILTGNLYPNDIIIARAEERDVPIILVRRDTLTIVQQVEDIMMSLRVRDKRKINRAIQLVSEDLDFSTLYERLELNK